MAGRGEVSQNSSDVLCLLLCGEFRKFGSFHLPRFWIQMSIYGNQLRFDDVSSLRKICPSRPRGHEGGGELALQQLALGGEPESTTTGYASSQTFPSFDVGEGRDEG
jgi:hypothetical protein